MRHIATPEGVTFSLPLAGPVIRAVAMFIDFAVCQVLQRLLMLAISTIAVLSSDLAMGSYYVMLFAINFGYAAVCELLFGGQTLGKRVMRIRVMDERGLKLRPGQVIIRNLLRIVDMFPIFYAVGGLFALFNKRCQRLGDLAAGTVVVRSIKIAPPNVEGVLGGKYNSFRQHPHLEARLRQKVTPDEAQLALAALVRREELDASATVRLFSDMAQCFREKVKFPEETTFGISDEQYVRNVVDTLYRKSASSR